MYYATQYHIRYNQNTPTTKTTPVTQTVGAVRRLDAETKGCRRDTKGQTAIPAGSHAANGFLRCSFLPKLKEPQTVQSAGKSAKTERDFYQSLSQLAAHYGLQAMQTKQYGYPYNIALALDDAGKQLKDNMRDWEEIKLLQDSRKTFLTSTERYSTGTTLYYIPVVPLFRLLKNPQRKKAAGLLLSVCSYLYRIADVPYYRQENSFLYWQYEMLKEWVLSDDYTDEINSYLSELQQAEWIGNRMEQKICNPANLKVFRQRLINFNGKDGFDNDCWELATEAFDLYKKYPDATIFRNAKPNGEAEEDDLDYVLTMDKYVSFSADGKGWLNENLEECVSNELQEYGQMEEPIITKVFKGKEIASNTLDFENRLFALLEELAYLLNNF
ncbi:hypothetical protein [Agriterribacter sp.]|uniref:hypothetical protein n=1 Tax=Agriterribacter sp. TaxID=2821509 RepID=UPI002BF987E3|nr:hypothetical protein [Agriterribacter sp.]HRO46221.1 hypothetical protein [Agriterribacter sp.]